MDKLIYNFFGTTVKLNILSPECLTEIERQNEKAKQCQDKPKLLEIYSQRAWLNMIKNCVYDIDGLIDMSDQAPVILERTEDGRLTDAAVLSISQTDLWPYLFLLIFTTMYCNEFTAPHYLFDSNNVVIPDINLIPLQLVS